MWPASARRPPSVAEQHPSRDGPALTWERRAVFSEECGDRVEMEGCKGV